MNDYKEMFVKYCDIFITYWKKLPRGISVILSMLSYTWVVVWFSANFINPYTWVIFPYVFTVIAGYICIAILYDL